MQTAVLPKGVEQPEVTSLDFSRIAQDLQIRKLQVEAVVQLLDEDNTVPFITRYRKERTGGLNEDVIRLVQMRVGLLRQLADRKQTVLRSIDGQGKLTDELRRAVLAADTSKRLEDLYLPYKPKKKSLASAAREKGLEPLALAVWNRDPAAADFNEMLPSLVNPEKGLANFDDITNGVMHILAEKIAETAEVRATLRSLLWQTGKISSVRSEKLAEGQGLDFKDYFQFSEPLREIPPHRILALNRGEKENALRVSLQTDPEMIRTEALIAVASTCLQQADAAAAAAAKDGTPPPPPLTGESLLEGGEFKTPHAAFLRKVVEDALQRLLMPSLEREIRRELTDESEGHAVVVFARNLRSLLLQPPLRGRRVLAIDPGFRSGCKIAALDEMGNLLSHDVVYPHFRESKKKEAARAAHAESQAGPVSDSAGTPAAPMETEVPVAPVADATIPEGETAAPPVIPASGIEAAPVVPTPVSEGEAAVVPAASAEGDAAAVPVAHASGSESDTAIAPAPVAEAASTPSAPAPSKRMEAKQKLHDLVVGHNLNVVAIGNGTACRETEEFVSELIQEKLPELTYVIVNEAGASVYSASSVGREEFPEFDATLRGTISIGRRLQDPLSELVKVDPQSIGVGLYQHDVNPRHLKESLEGVIESCVNQVGVDLNTASVPLLRHVSGLNQMVARDLVAYRNEKGRFTNRQQLMQVPNIGPGRFMQAAGFLKIAPSDNPLDRTWIHPESYDATQKLLTDMGYGLDVIEDKSRHDEFQNKLKTIDIHEAAGRLGLGEPTVHDILDSLARPGRDPREDLPPPIFKKGILKLEDLQPNMELKGTVLNVVDFGAFVDIGLKDSGLVHISQMANRYIKSPYDVVAVSDVVTVWVLTVDKDRHRVSLTMIQPGTERKPQERERRPQESHDHAPRQQGDRPPARGRHNAGAVPAQGHHGQGGQGRSGPPRQGQGQGRPSGPPQRRQQAPAGQQPRQPAPPPPPPPPPRKPRKETPRPKLSEDQKEGKVPLRTFSELSALFAAKVTPPPAPTPAPVPIPDVIETPAALPAVAEAVEPASELVPPQ